jgi:hypothetical protein
VKKLQLTLLSIVLKLPSALLDIVLQLLLMTPVLRLIVEQSRHQRNGCA